MTETMSVRITEEQVKGIDFIAGFHQQKKSETLRGIVDFGIKSKRLELALEKFQKNEATAWKAARIAGISLTSFLDVLRKHQIVFHYSKEDLDKDLRGLG